MNLVTTQHSSNKFGSAFAAPRFSYLRFIFLFMNLFNGDGKVSEPDRRCNEAVGGEKSVFTRTPPLIRTPKIPVNICCA